MVATYYQNLGTVSDEGDVAVVSVANVLQRRRHTFYIEGAADVDAGDVIVETAATENYPGVWAPADGMNAVSVPTGAALAVSFEGAFAFLRVRVTADIEDSGGSATTANIVYVAN